MKIPRRLFIEITSECNLKCELCKMWKIKDSENRLNLNEKIRFIKGIIWWLEKADSRNKENFSVILTGGEPFLHPEQVFKIASLCNLNEINCFINTNGALLYPFSESILTSGLTAITISLDSHINKIHEKLRHSPGLFDDVIKTIKKMVKIKKHNNLSIQICIQSILADWNINKLPAYVSSFKDLNIDGIIFQPLQYPFGLSIPIEWYKTFKEFPKNKIEIEGDVGYLLDEKQENGLIMNSKEEIKL